MTTRRPVPPSQKRTEKLNNVLADMVIRGDGSPRKKRKSAKDQSRTPTPLTQERGEQSVANAPVGLKTPIAMSLVDFSFVLGLVFGGCCVNVWAYEYLLKIDSHMGAALTFSQMVFVTLTSLPSFLSWEEQSFSFFPLPRLKPRQVPLFQWAVQVVVLTTGSLLNNWAFAFKVPLTIQIVFRSAGLAVSMLFGWLFMHKRYSLKQVGAVFLVSIGVLLSTTSRPSTSFSKAHKEDITQYTIGVAMLTVSLLLTGLLGLLQERTYTRYGPCWREGVFYTHFLSLPIFAFLIPDIKRGFASLTAASDYSQYKQISSWVIAIEYTSTRLPQTLKAFSPYLILIGNLMTQLVCVSGVNQLTSRVSSVSTNLVLTTRKAISLCFSVWWFGNGWNTQLGVGAGMVFFGSLLYTAVTSRSPPPATAAARETPEIVIKHEKED